MRNAANPLRHNAFRPCRTAPLVFGCLTPCAIYLHHVDYYQCERGHTTGRGDETMATETIRERLAGMGWSEAEIQKVTEGSEGSGRLTVYTTHHVPGERPDPKTMPVAELIPEGSRLRMGGDHVAVSHPAADTMVFEADSGERVENTWTSHSGLIAHVLDAEIVIA